MFFTDIRTDIHKHSTEAAFSSNPSTMSVSKLDRRSLNSKGVSRGAIGLEPEFSFCSKAEILASDPKDD